MGTVLKYYLLDHYFLKCFDNLTVDPSYISYTSDFIAYNHELIVTEIEK